MHPLWDWPTRIMHWVLPFLLALAWWSAENQRYDIHEWTGFSLLVIVGTRITWGVVGSVHSRFGDFVVGPRRVLAYLKGHPGDTPGHNPLGGWSVLAMLLLLLVQAVSGLFNSDDVLYNGPLYYAADVSLRDAMGAAHDWVFDILLGLVGLHVAVVAYHQWIRRDGMITAMLRGSAENRSGLRAPAPWWLALLIAAGLGLLLWWGLAQAPQPAPVWF